MLVNVTLTSMGQLSRGRSITRHWGLTLSLPQLSKGDHTHNLEVKLVYSLIGVKCTVKSSRFSLSLKLNSILVLDLHISVQTAFSLGLK